MRINIYKSSGNRVWRRSSGYLASASVIIFTAFAGLLLSMNIHAQNPTTGAISPTVGATFTWVGTKPGLPPAGNGEPTCTTGDTTATNCDGFALTVEPASASRPSSYSITADPQVGEGVTATGTRHYYTDSSLSSIKATDENRPSKVDDPAL